MNNLEKIFKNKKTFVPFITCGDPNLDITEKLVYAMEEAGADLIELGIPFSDPVAEGPTIQGANVRALAGGVTTDKVFEMVRRIRKKSTIPLAFMTYANVVFSYGTERFIKLASEVGISAILLPDVPFEEKHEFEPICEKYNIAFISFVTPLSQERIAMIASEAKGFLYCVSSLGVTGVRSEMSSNIEEMIRTVKATSDIPCLIGFGISTCQQVEKASGFADGVIVGSAIIQRCEQYGEQCVPHVKAFVAEMKNALR